MIGVCEIDFKKLHKLVVRFKRAATAEVPAFGGGGGLADVAGLRRSILLTVNCDSCCVIFAANQP
jgi:hypothetical protein